MRPVVSVAEMKAIDAAAVTQTELLVRRAGSAVAWAARHMLGGTYGRRVVVVAGPGNNGADGRVAAELLNAWGARADVVEVADAAGQQLRRCDLVIDAAYGTGLRGDYEAPDPGNAAVLAVDIPSGVNGDTGIAAKGAVRADATVTMAALKQGLLFADGRQSAGALSVADIGLDVSSASTYLFENQDAAGWLVLRQPTDNKWTHSVAVVGGSPGMTGAPHLVGRGALRAGAGMVRVWTPGTHFGADDELVGEDCPDTNWAEVVAAQLDRFKALVVGPGLGRSAQTAGEVARLLELSDVPTVVDADGLWALAKTGKCRDLSSWRSAPTILTPHDGEYQMLIGHKPAEDRIAAARELARYSGAVVLLKGGPTVIASADADTWIVNSGDERLATPGTGDVLSGVIGSFCSRGINAVRAAVLGAHVHGCAAKASWREGFVAGDLPEAIPPVLESLEGTPASYRQDWPR